MSGTRICPYEWWISALFVFFIFYIVLLSERHRGLSLSREVILPSLQWQQYLNPNYLSGEGAAEEKQWARVLFFLPHRHHARVSVTQNRWLQTQVVQDLYIGAVNTCTPLNPCEAWRHDNDTDESTTIDQNYHSSIFSPIDLLRYWAR